MGSLFNINNVLVSESSIYSNTVLENLTESSYKKSFMNMAYDYITESTIFFNNLNKKFYRTVSESQGDFYIVNEAFEGFLDKVKEIIKKFLEFIKRVFNEFIARLNGMFRSEKYLKKNIKELNKFNSDHEFDLEVYEFTNIRENKPDIKVFDLVVGTGDAKDIAVNHGTIASNTWDDGGQVAKTVKAAYDNLKDELNEDYYDKVRGKLIEKANGVSAGDFPDELFAYFRNDDMDKTNTTITSSYVMDAKAKFLGYESLKKGIERTKKDIEREYEDARKALERMMSTSGKDINLTASNAIAIQTMGIQSTDKKHFSEPDYQYDKDEYKDANATKQITGASDPQKTRTIIDSYLKTKVSQVQALSNIHSQVFAAKLEAAKDEFNQNKTVLYRALYKVTGKQKKL